MAVISNPQTLDLDDIQGMITRGYGKLMQTYYFLLQVEDAAKGRAWLKSVLPTVDSATITNRAQQTVHLAFTFNGLKALGMSDKNAQQFPVPFREGMATDNRARILGDYGDSDPTNWRWGATDQHVHILMVLHAVDEDSMKQWLAVQQDLLTKAGGIKVLKHMSGYQQPDNKEPFGFHDGISQPTIEGSGRPGPENDIIKTGEFLMGYKNEHDQYPYTPLLEEQQGNPALLADDAAGTGKKDLGRNGTFMVYRQIEQHVDAFWNYMADKTKNPDGTENKEEKVRLAAKCVGRWPSGASLVNFPDKDPGGAPANDDFGYADLDPEGLRCPYSSHLRRNNPRDAFRWYNKKQSLKVTSRHRIIRRGRIYKGPDGGGVEKDETGLHFICFNADLQLQFEFIQHAWANNNQLRHLSNDIDMIIGAPLEQDPSNDKIEATIQALPTNKFVETNYSEEKGWERFVTIRGGQYFFMPSISVLNYLTTL